MDNNSDKELEPKELEETLYKLKESMQSDMRQAALWNSLGLILLKTGRLQVQVCCCFCSQLHVPFHSLIWSFLSSVECY